MIVGLRMQSSCVSQLRAAFARREPGENVRRCCRLQRGCKSGADVTSRSATDMYGELTDPRM